MKTFTTKQIAEYIKGWTAGEFGKIEEKAKYIFLNALNQLEDEQDGIEAYFERKEANGGFCGSMEEWLELRK